MSPPTPTNFSPRAAEKIARAVKQLLGTSTSITPPAHSRLNINQRYIGKLTEALDAPTDGMASPTTAKMKLWFPDKTSTASPKPFLESDTEITAVNRDPSRSGDVDAWCKIEFLNGEWSFYDVECPA